MENIDWDEVGRVAIEHFLNDWVQPMANKRLEAGELAAPLEIRAAQVILFPDETPPLLRLNSEVQAVGEPVYRDGIIKNAGDPVYSHEIVTLNNVHLQAAEVDLAHITLLLINGVWHLYFDFRRNRGLAGEHLEAARQFLSAAQHCFEHDLWRAFIDNLFSGTELAAKALLLAYFSDSRFRDKANHKAIKSRFNLFASRMDLGKEHTKTFNALLRMRPNARYLDEPFSISREDAQRYLSSVESLLDEIAGRLI